jgi:hypothetical protein
MGKHTSGPWATGGNVYSHSRTAVMQEESALLVAEVCDWPDEETDRANARLIAAAPDLLAACQAELEVYDGMDAATLMPKTLARIAALRAAVEKATTVSLPEAQ